LIQRLRVEINETALQDLRDIAAYIVERAGSKAVAKGFASRIRARCQRIGDVPRGGRLISDVVKGLRLVPFEHSAVIAYLVEDDCVRITNIFYGGRDYETLLRGDEPSDEDE